MKKIFYILFVFIFLINCIPVKKYGLNSVNIYKKTTIKEVINNNNISIGENYLITGKIESQCKKDYCWFKIKDNNNNNILIDLKPNNIKVGKLENKKVKVIGNISFDKNNKIVFNAISVKVLMF